MVKHIKHEYFQYFSQRISEKAASQRLHILFNQVNLELQASRNKPSKVFYFLMQKVS